MAAAMQYQQQAAAMKGYPHPAYMYSPAGADPRMMMMAAMAKGIIARNDSSAFRFIYSLRNELDEHAWTRPHHDEINLHDLVYLYENIKGPDEDVLLACRLLANNDLVSAARDILVFREHLLHEASRLVDVIFISIPQVLCPTRGQPAAFRTELLMPATQPQPP